MSICGIVLAGGQSSRYGRPKMFELYKGIPFYEHSIHSLTNSGVQSIYIVTNEELSPYFRSVNAELLIEKERHNGPLSALSFAMESIKQHNWFFVLASDIPFVTSTFVKRMITYTGKQSSDAIVPITGDREQPLLSLYHRRCLPFAQEILANNRKSMQPLLQSVNVEYVQFSSIQKDFININHQEDWIQLHDKGDSINE